MQINGVGPFDVTYVRSADDVRVASRMLLRFVTRAWLATSRVEFRREAVPCEVGPARTASRAQLRRARASRGARSPARARVSIRAGLGQGTEYCHVERPGAVGVDDDCFLILESRPRLLRAASTRRGPCNRCLDLLSPRAGRGDRRSDRADAGPGAGLRVDARSRRPRVSWRTFGRTTSWSSPVLRFVKAHVLQGSTTRRGTRSRCMFLLERMQAHRARTLALADELRLVRQSRRARAVSPHRPRDRLPARELCATARPRRGRARRMPLEVSLPAAVHAHRRHHARRLSERKRSAVAVRLLQATPTHCRRGGCQRRLSESARRCCGRMPALDRAECACRSDGRRFPRPLPRPIAAVN